MARIWVYLYLRQQLKVFIPLQVGAPALRQLRRWRRPPPGAAPAAPQGEPPRRQVDRVDVPLAGGARSLQEVRPQAERGGLAGQQDRLLQVRRAH